MARDAKELFKSLALFNTDPSKGVKGKTDLDHPKSMENIAQAFREILTSKDEVALKMMADLFDANVKGGNAKEFVSGFIKGAPSVVSAIGDTVEVEPEEPDTEEEVLDVPDEEGEAPVEPDAEEPADSVVDGVDDSMLDSYNPRMVNTANNFLYF